MPVISLTAKEINLLVQAIRIAMETGELQEYGKGFEIEALRNKLQNVKGV